MTEREPDDLYDALRDRLADYGQEPPAPLWANIRAQLPPPVAVPQRRRKRQLALLALLLLVASVGSWQWWRSAQKRNLTASETAHVNATPSVEDHRSKTSIASHAAASLPVQPSAAGASQTSQALPEPSVTLSDHTVALPTAPNTVEAENARTRTAASGQPVMQPAQARARKTQASEQLAAVVGTSNAAPSHVATAIGSATEAREGRARAAKQPWTGQGNNSALTAIKHSKAVDELIISTADIDDPSTRKAKHSRTAIAKQAVNEGQVMPESTAASAILVAGEEAKPPQDVAPHAGFSRSRHAAEATDGVTPVTQPSLESASFAAWNLLQPRPIDLLLQAWAGPNVQPVADTLPKLAVAVASRWAVQVLAGPALTYRRLGSNNLSYAAPPSFNTPNDAFPSARQERSAFGFGAQVQVRRVLNGRWSISAGLGYQTYAVNTDVQRSQFIRSVPAGLPSTSLNNRDSTITTSYTLRDAYHFLTVPVRMSYQLGAGGRRFRFGLLAGADVAIYLGGATAETSACGCQTKTWGLTSSPYRPLSVALNLGFDLRYRLAPRWELVAQPSGTFFLTPLARSTSGLSPRYLLGGGTLLGVSYGLR